MSKILLVEDEMLVAQDIRNCLASADHQVLPTVRSGEKAVQQAGASRPDLILMDIILSGKMDGIEAAEIIQSRYKLPVVYLTSYSDTKTQTRAKATSPYGYILKPFNHKDLLVTVEMALSRHAVEKQMNQVQDALEKSEKKYRHLVENSRDGIIILDRSNKVLFVNPAAERLFGRKSQDMIGQAFGYSNIAEGKDEIMIGSRNGSSVVAEINSVPVDWEGETGFLATFRDVTERKKYAEKLKEGLKKFNTALIKAVHAMSLIIETRDPYTAGHQRRVANLASAIGKELGLGREQVRSLGLAGEIHDIGKIHVPAEILSKPSRLNDNEFSLIKNHSRIGYDILKEIDFPWPIADIVHQHHERLDGSGYPLGKTEPEILVEAKILAVADVVEAMSYHRPYRPALGIGRALEEIKAQRTVLYDPAAADACVCLIEKKRFDMNDNSQTMSLLRGNGGRADSLNDTSFICPA